MDPISFTATCIGLASTITRTSLIVIGFVKDVRAARSDLDAVSRELLSLKTVLELLADDVNDSNTKPIPQMLQKQITGIVTNCTGVVVDIEQTLKKHEGGKLNKAAKWVASGKSDVAKLQLSLEAHKSALEIALDMVTLTLAREIKADTQEILNDTSAIKEDTAQILAEIAWLQEQLPRDRNQLSAGFMLERYLDNLTSYAETVCDGYLDGSDGSRLPSRPGSSGGDDWDSPRMVKESTTEMEKAKLMASLEQERKERAEIESQKKSIEQELENLTAALFEEANKMVITAREEAQKEHDIVQRRNDQLKAQLVDMERLLEWNQEQRKNIKGISTGASMTTPVTAVVTRLSAD